MAEELITVTARLAAERPWWRRVLARAFVIYIALNMLTCAVLFAPWALPRETISGLLGRWIATEYGIKRIAGNVLGLIVNLIYFWEPDHCVEVWRCERQAREVLYP